MIKIENNFGRINSSEHKLINTLTQYLVIVDKSDNSTTVYQYCGDGTPIDEFTIYTKEGNSIVAASGRDLVAKYADAFTIKLLNETEY